MRLTTRSFVAGPISFLLFSATALAHNVDTALEIDVTRRVNCTRHALAGDTITVHYVGTLAFDGSVFDSSRNFGQPFTFTLGAGQVIKGWDEGLLGMCVGEQRKLTIPPSMGYGDRTVGPIPGGSTLIFDTELMGIEGVQPYDPEHPYIPTEEAQQSQSSESQSGTDATATAQAAGSSATSLPADGAPPTHEGKDDGQCHLLGPFALLVQAALGLLALLSLVWKRHRETPQRPLKIWFFDASKQVFGSVLLHLANLFMSLLSSGTFDVKSVPPPPARAFFRRENGRPEGPNPCSFYLLNLAIDTTIGIPILVILLRLLHVLFSKTPLARPPQSIKSGNYGEPPRWTWWLKQSLIYFIGLFGMKLCVFFLFQILPWIAWVGDWALRWTEGNQKVQIAFVMFIFPVIMNAIQYYIIDSFIKENNRSDEDDARGEHRPLAQHDEDDSDDEEDGQRGGRSFAVGEEEVEDGPLKEANPTVVPSYGDDERGGSSHGKPVSYTRSRSKE